MSTLGWLSTKAKSLVISGRNAVVYHFVEAKVREATSNQPCDNPKLTLKEIADYSHNMYANNSTLLKQYLATTI
jgi:hypothetical protein